MGGGQQPKKQKHPNGGDPVVTRTLDLPQVPAKSPLVQIISSFLAKITQMAPHSKFILRTNRANQLYISAIGGEDYLKHVMERLKRWIRNLVNQDTYVVTVSKEELTFMVLSSCKRVLADLTRALETAPHLSARLYYNGRDEAIDIRMRPPLNNNKHADEDETTTETQQPSLEQWKKDVYEFLDQFMANRVSYEKFDMIGVFGCGEDALTQIGSSSGSAAGDVQMSADQFKQLLEQLTFSLKSARNEVDFYFSRSKLTLEIYGYKSECEQFKDTLLEEMKGRDDGGKMRLALNRVDDTPTNSSSSSTAEKKKKSLTLYTIESNSLLSRVLANCRGVFCELRDKLQEFKLNLVRDLDNDDDNDHNCFIVVYNEGDLKENDDPDRWNKIKRAAENFMKSFEEEQTHECEANMSSFFPKEEEGEIASVAEDEFRKRLMHVYVKSYPENRYFVYTYSPDGTKLTMYGKKCTVSSFWSDWVQPKLMYKTAEKLLISPVEHRLLYLIVTQFGDNFKQEISDTLDDRFKGGFVGLCAGNSINSPPMIRHTGKISSGEIIAHLAKNYLTKFAAQTLVALDDNTVNFEEIKTLLVRKNLIDRDRCYIEIVVNNNNNVVHKDPRQLAQQQQQQTDNKGPVRVYGLKHCVKQMTNFLQLFGLVSTAENENLEDGETTNHDSQTTVYPARSLAHDVLTHFDRLYLKDLAANLFSIFKAFYEEIDVSERRVIVRYRKCHKLVSYLDLYFAEFSQQKLDVSTKAEEDFFRYCIESKINKQRVTYKYDASNRLLIFGMTSDVKKLAYMVKNQDALVEQNENSPKSKKSRSGEYNNELIPLTEIKLDNSFSATDMSTSSKSTSESSGCSVAAKSSSVGAEFCKVLKIKASWFHWEMLQLFDINQTIREQNMKARVDFDPKMNELRISGPREQNLQPVSLLVQSQICKMVVEALDEKSCDRLPEIIREWESNREDIRGAIRAAQLSCVIDTTSSPGLLLIYSSSTSQIEECKKLLLDQV